MATFCIRSAYVLTNVIVGIPEKNKIRIDFSFEHFEHPRHAHSPPEQKVLIAIYQVD